MFDWFRKRNLSSAVPPLRDQWLVISVVLRSPEHVAGTARPLVGYFQTFGVRCLPERVRQMIEAEIQDGMVVWDESEATDVLPHELPAEVRSRITPVDGEGVWYKTGRALFPADG